MFFGLGLDVKVRYEVRGLEVEASQVHEFNIAWIKCAKCMSHLHGLVVLGQCLISGIIYGGHFNICNTKDGSRGLDYGM